MFVKENPNRKKKKKKIPGGILLKMLKCFEAMLNIFELYKKLVKNKES